MFNRERLLIGDKVEVLGKKTVMIIGLGGVGGYVVEGLVRAGIGNIIIVDYDVIDVTNINRQLIATTSNIGLNKIDEWFNRIKDINPNCHVTKINSFVTLLNIDDLFENKVDYIIDACDTVMTKKEIIRQCLRRNIKFISSMGTGNKFEPLRFKITDIRKTSYDPIAKIIRKMITDEKIKGKVMVLWSDEVPQKTGDIVGSMSYVPSVAGLVIAGYVINSFIKGDA